MRSFETSRYIEQLNISLTAWNMLEWNKCNQFIVYSWRTWFPFWSINIMTNIQWECWDRMRQPCSSRCPTHDGCVEIGWHYHNICWWPNMMVTGMLRWLVGRHNHLSVAGLYTCAPPPPHPHPPARNQPHWYLFTFCVQPLSQMGCHISILAFERNPFLQSFLHQKNTLVSRINSL